MTEESNYPQPYKGMKHAKVRCGLDAGPQTLPRIVEQMMACAVLGISYRVYGGEFDERAEHSPHEPMFEMEFTGWLVEDEDCTTAKDIR